MLRLGDFFRIHTAFYSSESAQTLRLYNRNSKKDLFEMAVATVPHPSLSNTHIYKV